MIRSLIGSSFILDFQPVCSIKPMGLWSASGSIIAFSRVKYRSSPQSCQNQLHRAEKKQSIFPPSSAQTGLKEYPYLTVLLLQ
jgi:hypothetical protein